MNFEHALKSLKVKETSTPYEIISSYNIKLKKCKDTNQKEILQQARSTAIKNYIQKQVRNNGKFTIQGPEGSCEKCNGTGEIFKFKKEFALVSCKRCDGLGKIYSTCNKCNGTGRYKHKSFGLIINVKCKRCDGTGKIDFKCKTCLGKKIVKKLVITPNIESSNECKFCNGTGRKPIKKSPNITPSNPALSLEIGTMLLQRI